MDIPLTKQQKEIVIGTVLGDGYLEFNGCRGTRLQIKQSKKHKDYVFWLYSNLKSLCKSEPKQRKDTEQWYFSTRSLDELTDIHRIFYPKGKKIVPKEIKNLLDSSLSLAIWYMDDGKLDFIPKVHCSPYFCTDSFSFKDVESLINVLRENFGVMANIQNYSIRNNIYPRIYIKAITRDNFFSVIRKHIIKCFHYKLPSLSNPSETEFVFNKQTR